VFFDLIVDHSELYYAVKRGRRAWGKLYRASADRKWVAAHTAVVDALAALKDVSAISIHSPLTHSPTMTQHLTPCDGCEQCQPKPEPPCFRCGLSPCRCGSNVVEKAITARRKKTELANARLRSA
jgi:uncharacterized paraquat-inducible protein A